MKETTTVSADAAGTERFAAKYLFLREKLLKNYQKGRRIYRTAKVVAAALFLVYSLAAVLVGRHTGQPMGPLVMWLVQLFAIVFIFLIAEYAKYLLEDKVIPYLEDDEALEYGEYDIFRDDDEDPDEQEDEDE